MLDWGYTFFMYVDPPNTFVALPYLYIKSTEHKHD